MMQNSQQVSKIWKSSSGLTLIEVLIAMALLAFISIAIYQATTRSFDINYKLSAESTDYSAIVLGLQAVERDISQIFTPTLGTSKVPPDSQPADFWSAPVRSDGFRRSRLRGTKESLSFVANNNRRLEEGSPQSDFVKISWHIERNESGAYSLYRTMDWDVYNYERVSRSEPSRVALFDNLTSANFSYFRKEGKTWEDQWDSEGAYTKEESRFPDLISLKIEVPDPTNPANQQPWEIIIKPNLSLNVMEEKKATASGQNPENGESNEPEIRGGE